MMQFVTRLLTLFAAAFMAAHPVMACPLMVGTSETAPTEMSSNHPCNDMAMEAMADTGHTDQASSSDCPAGYDCAPMLIQAHSDANPVAPVANVDAEFAAVLANPPKAFLPERETLKPGPPPRLDIVQHTPISLKQRFLN